MGAMPGDPKECREHAAVCQQLANTASTEHVREVFQNLARTWLRLANELDTAKALLDTWGDDSFPQAGSNSATRSRQKPLD
jgi:hypothetical protein